LTSQGHPRTVFERAIERGNLTVAEATLRAEIPRPTLVDLLDLSALIATKEPHRYARVSARWLLRYMQAVEDVTIDDVAFVTGCLQALGSRHHGHALTALRDMAETATSRGARRDVARRRAGQRQRLAFGSPPGPASSENRRSLLSSTVTWYADCEAN
jgi:hypothetical protein